MFSQLRNARLRNFDYSAMDLRALAEPVAVLSPVALIVSAQQVVMTIVSLLFILQSWRSRDFSWARQSWFAALLILWVYGLLRTAVDHPTATGVLQALQWINLPLYAAALAYWILPDEKSRDRLLFATAGALTFYALDCVLQYVVGRDIIWRPALNYRLTSVFSKPGVGIEIAWLVLPPVLGLWQKGRTVFAIVFGLLCAVAVLLSGDRMALLILVGYAVLIALILPRLRKPLLIALPVAGALLGSILYLNPSIYHRQIETTVEVIGHIDESPYGVIYKSAFEMARDHTIFGVGMHNYQAVCTQDQYGPLRIGPEQLLRCAGHPHNSYLEWLVDFGVIGLAFYVAFVVAALGRLVRWARANQDNLIFYGVAVSLVLRFSPLSAGTSFFSSWSAEPLFLILGWSLVYCQPQRSAEIAAGDRSGLSASVAHVSHASSVGV
jgi:O-antigen ligase